MKKIISLLLVVALAAGCFAFSSFAALKGDVNNDGTVNSSDALIILQYSVGMITDEDVDKALLDVDGDGNVNSSDALIVLQISVGIITPEDPDKPEDPDEPDDPATKAEIVDAYNKAVNKAVDEKAGYKKVRVSQLGKLEGADALMKISAAKNAVYEFLNIGETKYENKKGSADYFMKSTLADADVKSATYTKTGDNAVIKLTLNDGKCTAPVKTETSPLVRSGIVCGTDPDNASYDYKNAANIYDAISGASGASVQTVSGKTENIVITAEVNTATGNLTSLSIKWNASVTMTKLKYTLITINATGSMTTDIKLSDFAY